MDGAALIDACSALAIAARLLYTGHSAGVPARVRKATHVVLAVALLVQAGVLILSAVRDSRNDGGNPAYVTYSVAFNSRSCQWILINVCIVCLLVDFTTYCTWYITQNFPTFKDPVN